LAPASAFGISDQAAIVGQTTTGIASPGVFVSSNTGAGLTKINAPSGPNIVNAQGINSNGLIAGFYVGTDGQDHGFTANAASASNGVLTGTSIADPIIPDVSGQHGFLYNAHTGHYWFVDDPSEMFSNGVEVTQITGITNSGEQAGFYSGANGVDHGFVACLAGVTTCSAAAVSLPGSLSLLAIGLGVLGIGRCGRGLTGAQRP
jgi:hypothetical protein